MNFGATGSNAYTSLSARFRSLLGMWVAYIMFTVRTCGGKPFCPLLSSLKLLYQDIVRKMGIDPSRIKPTKTTFKGVIPGVEANCTGSVTLEVVFGSPDNFRSEELIFATLVSQVCEGWGWGRIATLARNVPGGLVVGYFSQVVSTASSIPVF